MRTAAFLTCPPQFGDDGGQVDGHRLQYMDLPIPGHHARQGRPCPRQCPRPRISQADLQATFLWYQTCLCLRRRSTSVEENDHRESMEPAR